MKNLLNPKLLFIVNTIPIIILFLLLWGEYKIIHTLLSPQNKILWAKFGIALATLGGLSFIYALILSVLKKPVSLLYSVIALFSYIVYLYLYTVYLNDIMPANIPQWMMPTNLILYVGTFLMPTLAYCFFCIVLYFTPAYKNYAASKNFFLAVLIPILWYVFFQIILPILHNNLDSKFATHLLVILLITSTFLCLFFLVRTVYILTFNNSQKWKKYELAWKIPITLVFPILGLLTNNGLVFNFFVNKDTGFFGNFTNPIFYILAIINGILLCLPNKPNVYYRWILFVARSITFAFTVYFFLVFLPFLPISIFAVLAVGFGFLMLTPLLLFVIHSNELVKDAKFLQNYCYSKLIPIVAFFSFLVIPIIITTNYLHHKRVLTQTLNYVYSSDYTKSYKIDTISLSNTLNNIKKNKLKLDFSLFGDQIPYLTSYFNWIVLDNLTLSDSKIKAIENIFFGSALNSLTNNNEPISVEQLPSPANNANNTVPSITAITANTTFDTTKQLYSSWINMEITNNSSLNNAEYSTTFELPTGCYISNYYLFVNGVKEMGLLAEKKAALWVYQQISITNQDPGILYYLNLNTIAFKVFPFLANETRKTGFEIIHKEPISFAISGKTLNLGTYTTPNLPPTIESTHQNVLYVSAKQKEQLPQTQRNPYYHFIIDVSKGKEQERYNYIKNIKELQNQHLISFDNAQISFVNSYTLNMPFDSTWQQQLLQQTCLGGFFAERAIKSALVSHYNKKNNSYPIIVVVSNNFNNAQIEKDFADLSFTYPENNYFYVLKNDGYLEAHDLSNQPKQPLTKNNIPTFNNKVLAYPNLKKPIAYLPNNQTASIIVSDTPVLTNNLAKEKDWQTGLLLSAAYQWQTLHPEISNAISKKIVYKSIASKIMTPLTAYMVLENEAQKAALLQKQQQILAGNKNLDAGEELQAMSEPNLWILIAFLILVLFFIKKR